MADSAISIRSRAAQVLVLSVDSASAVSLAEQIYQGVRREVLGGRLRGGSRIASSRRLAEEWRVSRFTVVTVADRNSPIAEQAALAEFIDDGSYDRHLRRLRLVHQERQRAMIRQFDRVFGSEVAFSRAAAGTHLLAWFNGRRPTGDAETRAVRISAAAGREGMVVFPLSRYCLQRPLRDALVLGYGSLTPRTIAHATEKLLQIVRECRRHDL